MAVSEKPWAVRIRTLRLELAERVPREYSQAAVARRLGVDPDTVRAWETGRSKPRKAMARRLARILGVKVEDLQLEASAPAAPEAVAEVARPSVALAVIVHEGRALMTRRRWSEGPFQWNFVSGEIEAGETPEQAAGREAREEVGLDVEVERRIGDRIQPVSGRHMVYLICSVAAGADLAQLVDHEENTEVVWCTLGEVYERLASLAEVPGGLYPPLFEYLDRVLAPAAPA